VWDLGSFIRLHLDEITSFDALFQHMFPFVTVNITRQILDRCTSQDEARLNYVVEC
jgi:hypothetical protein